MKEYVVLISGVEHTLLLDDEDVQRYPDAKPAKRPAKPSAPSATKG